MPARILIADDSLTMRQQLRKFLESNREWQVCGEAVDGRDAVEKAQLLKPDVILLDLAMPQMDGLTTAKQILRHLSAVPVILYTLHSSPQLELEAGKAGIQSVVAKQDGINALSAAIKSALRTKQPQQRPSATPAILNAATPVTSGVDPDAPSASNAEPAQKEAAGGAAAVPIKTDKPFDKA
ncbi:MAG TPA: response regulator [Terriglobales bacterium]|nr:response regulator [Terriglobales bacterium]